MQKYDNFPKNIYIYITNKKIKAVTGEGLIHLYIYIFLIMFENKEIILFIVVVVFFVQVFGLFDYFFCCLIITIQFRCR